MSEITIAILVHIQYNKSLTPYLFFSGQTINYNVPDFCSEPDDGRKPAKKISLEDNGINYGQCPIKNSNIINIHLVFPVLLYFPLL